MIHSDSAYSHAHSWDSLQRNDAKPHKENGKWGELQRKLDASFHSLVPIESQKMCLILSARSCETQVKCPEFSLGADHIGILSSVYQKPRLPERKQTCTRKYCWRRQPRHTLSRFLSVLGIAGILLKFEFPYASQGSKWPSDPPKISSLKPALVAFFCTQFLVINLSPLYKQI